MLELKELVWKIPDGDTIIDGISCRLDSRLTVITGPNGGGKTSLAKLIAGVEKPTGGRIILDGTDITDMDITGRAKLGIAYAFQQPVRFKGLTVRDLLELSAGKKLAAEETCALLGKVGLCAEEYIDREMSAALSGGEAKRIEIATVLARNAKLSVFDEIIHDIFFGSVAAIFIKITVSLVNLFFLGRRCISTFYVTRLILFSGRIGGVVCSF